MNYWHSTLEGCEIHPDKKSYSEITKRYSRHYCTTHKVILGHQAETGASNCGWQMHYYFGTASITDISDYTRLREHGRKLAQAKKDKRKASVPSV